MKKSESVLYMKILTARESCAGDVVKETWEVKRLIRDALHFAIKWDAEKSVLQKLEKSLTVMESVKVYKDRLPADRILCSILNNELRGYG